MKRWKNPRILKVNVSHQTFETLKRLAYIAIRPPSLRLSRTPTAICAKPASRLRKMRLSREPAEKNNRLSRREKCGFITENPLLQFSTSASYSPRPYSPSLAVAIRISLCLCIYKFINFPLFSFNLRFLLNLRVFVSPISYFDHDALMHHDQNRGCKNTYWTPCSAVYTFTALQR